MEYHAVQLELVRLIISVRGEVMVAEITNINALTILAAVVEEVIMSTSTSQACRMV